MKPETPAAPFEPLPYQAEPVVIETEGKILVVPTGNPDILPAFNEYTLSSNRLNISESPFGGVKGATPPDYGVGTVTINSGDGVYLTDTSGTNSSKTLPAGKLKELSLLTFDTTGHSFTEEFIVKNTNLNNNATLVDDCSSTTGWSVDTGTLSLSVVNGEVSATGTTHATSGAATITKNVNTVFANKHFIVFDITANVTCTLRLGLSSNATVSWTARNFSIAANTKTRFVLPLLAPAGSAGAQPSSNGGYLPANSTGIFIGITGTPNSAITFSIDNIYADVAKTALLEVFVPDYLADYGFQLGSYITSSYTNYGTYRVESAVAEISSASDYLRSLDGTQFNYMYGSGLGRDTFPIGISGQYLGRFRGYITYSSLKGTLKRLGFRLDLPPSDNGRTQINQVRIRAKSFYDSPNRSLKYLPDSSGNNLVGSIQGCLLTSDQTGAANKALSILGISGSYVNCGNPTALRITGAITIEAWIKMSDTTLTGGIVSRGEAFSSDGNFGYSLGFYGPTKELNFDTYSATTRSACYTQNAITDTNWHHIIATWDGTTNANGKKLYKDGTLIRETTSLISEIGTPTYNFYIGRDGTTPRNFSGSIGAVRIYNRGFSQADVTAQYQGTISRTGLVGEWKVADPVNMGSTTYEFSNDTSASTGLQNAVKPWVALYDPTTYDIDFYLFNYKPKGLYRKRDESGNIYELGLYPGNGNVYHGRIHHANPALDSNSNLIPNCLEPDVEGSVQKFLQSYGFAEDWYAEYDLSTSAIQTNDYSLTSSSIDIIPFATSVGDSLSNTTNVALSPSETVATATGNISNYDVRGLSAIRVRDSPYTNQGDCKIWDTVTLDNTTENTWKRVYTTDWVFTGNCVIENGLVRLKFATVPFVKIYYWSGSAWVFDRDVVDRQGGSNSPTIFSIAATTVETNTVKVTAYLSGHAAALTDYYNVEISLNRGNYFSKFVVLASSVTTIQARFYDNYDIHDNFLINEVVHDTRSFTSDTSWNLASNTGIGLNLSQTNNTLKVILAPKGNIVNLRQYSAVSNFTYPLIATASLPYTFYLGSIPFDCSKIYVATSAYELNENATRVDDATYPEGVYNLANYSQDYIVSPVLQFPVAGTYTLYQRVTKISGPDNPRMYLYDYTTMSSIFDITDGVTNNYVVKTFTLTEAQIGHELKLILRGVDEQNVNEFRYGFTLFVPTSLIKKHAYRALWNATPGTKTIKSSPR